MFFHKIDHQAQHFLQQNTICKGRHGYVCIGIPENHMSEALKSYIHVKISQKLCSLTGNLYNSTLSHTKGRVDCIFYSFSILGFYFYTSGLTKFFSRPRRPGTSLYFYL